MRPDLFPPATRLHTPIAKRELAAKLALSTKERRLLSQEVESIAWVAKLAPSVLNLREGARVLEIDVLLMPLKRREGDAGHLLRCLAQRLPRHALFVLEYGGESRLCIHYVRPLKVPETLGAHYHEVLAIFTSPWADIDALRLGLSGMDMDDIYEGIVRLVAGEAIRYRGGTLEEDVARTKQWEAWEMEIQRLEKLSLTLQPSKRYEMHRRILELKTLQKNG